MRNSNSEMRNLMMQYRIGLIVLVVFGVPSNLFGQTIARVPATVVAYESAELYAKAGGFLKSISVDIGDEVTAGQVLAVLDIPEMGKQLAQKKSLLALAEAELVMSKAKIEEAQAMLQALEASVREAQTSMASKQPLYDFQQAEWQRISGLVAQGAIQRGLLDSATYKLKSAEADKASVNAQVATANAKLAGGKAAVRRAEADMAAADAQIGVAKADMDYTSELMAYASIRAPWNGKVTERMFDTGAYIQSAQGNSGAKPVLKLVHDEKVRVAFSVSQKDLAGLKKGLKVTLKEIDALPGKSFEGTISRFSAELDSNTRMMRVEMDLDNAAGELKVGYFGYATIHYE